MVVLQPLGPPEDENRITPQDEGAILRCLLDLENPNVEISDTPENTEEAEVNLFRKFGETCE